MLVSSLVFVFFFGLLSGIFVFFFIVFFSSFGIVFAIFVGRLALSITFPRRGLDLSIPSALFHNLVLSSYHSPPRQLLSGNCQNYPGVHRQQSLLHYTDKVGNLALKVRCMQEDMLHKRNIQAPTAVDCFIYGRLLRWWHPRRCFILLPFWG